MHSSNGWFYVMRYATHINLCFATHMTSVMQILAETYSATANYVWPAAGQDLIPLQRLHVFAHSRDPHPAIKVWYQVPFTKSKTIFQIEIYCMQCFLKSKYIKVELSMIITGELLRTLWSLRSCYLILPPGALAPQGIKGVVKRDVSKHWCTLQ